MIDYATPAMVENVIYPLVQTKAVGKKYDGTIVFGVLNPVVSTDQATVSECRDSAIETAVSRDPGEILTHDLPR